MTGTGERCPCGAVGRWWGDHRVDDRSHGSKTLRHPVTGDLTRDWDALACADDPDQQLVVWTAEPGTPSHDGLRILASWAAAGAGPSTSETAGDG